MHNRKGGLERQCDGVKGDFMKMPFAENTFDGAYSIEATCHAPDRKAIYSQIYRALKPGSYFAMYEWCMTDKYDPSNAEHNEIKHGVEVGDALPPIMTCRETLQAVKDAGFEVVLEKDVVDNSAGMIPWYATLAGQWSLSGFRMTWLGRTITHNMCRAMEFLRIAPQGTVAASQLLMNAADSLVAAGQTEIFTPMYLVVGRKPLAK
jgi:sterol 24-C-methyltransferase